MARSGASFEKCVLKVAGTEAKDTYGNAQLYAGLEAGIEGIVHAACTLFAEKRDKEEWRFLLVDATNAFNRVACLWVAHIALRRAVQYELLPPPSATAFARR